MAEVGKNSREQRAASFARLVFEHYRGGLHRYLVRRLRNDEHARDLAQEVYLRLLRFSEQELVRQPEAYVYRVAFNVVCDFKLREGHDRVAFDSETFERLADEIADDAPSPVEAYERTDRERQLDAVLASLPPMQRAVFMMQKRQGLSYTQIARELGLSVKTVKTYLFRAVCHCRRNLADE